MNTSANDVALEGAQHLTRLLHPIGRRLSPVAYRMAVAAERDGYWRLAEDSRINSRDLPSVESIRDNSDLSNLLSVMLSTWRQDSPAPIPELRETGMDRRFVDKIRRIRNTCAHYDTGANARRLNDPEWLRDSEKAIQDFAGMVNAAAARRASMSSGPASSAPASTPRRPVIEASPSRRSSSGTTPGYTTPARRPPPRPPVTGPMSSPGRPDAPRSQLRPQRFFLLRPEFWAFAGGAIASIGIDFYGSGGVPQSGAAWNSPATVTGIACAVLALMSGLMSGRAVRINAILSLVLLPVLVILFALYFTERADSDGFYVLFGGLLLLWAAVTALMPVISVVRFVGQLRLER